MDWLGLEESMYKGPLCQTGFGAVGHAHLDIRMATQSEALRLLECGLWSPKAAMQLAGDPHGDARRLPHGYRIRHYADQKAF